jgi:hypothetical protein
LRVLDDLDAGVRDSTDKLPKLNKVHTLHCVR